MPERSKTIAATDSTDQTDYVDLLKVQVSPDSKGVSFLDLRIYPDTNGVYRVFIAGLPVMSEISPGTTFRIQWPHLTNGVYQGLKPRDVILIQHRKGDGTSIKSTASLTLSEVVEW